MNMAYILKAFLSIEQHTQDIGQRKKLSIKDILKLNVMYECIDFDFITMTIHVN